MKTNEPRDHHYVPQFFLRNFAVDVEKKKISTVSKNGRFAVLDHRSIEKIGYERDLYVHFRYGMPVSVETLINNRIETPISQSDTWAKIASGRTDAIDRADKAILYALIRHLEARSPHYFATTMELAHLANSRDNDIPFSEDEYEQYAAFRTHPEKAKEIFNLMALSLEWTEKNFMGSGLAIFRSPIPLRSSSIPVMSIKAPYHPSLHLPLAGMIPYQLILTLNPTTIACLTLADFDDAFMNIEIDAHVAQAFNRQFVGQFAYFENVRHLITNYDDLTVDMTWTGYSLIKNAGRKVTFARNS